MNNISISEKELSQQQREELLGVLKERFEKNMHRHKGIEWPAVQSRLEENDGKLWSLNEMERTGGEPDVVVNDKNTDEFFYCDCSPESPQGRRSLCYDQEGLDSRKSARPEGSAADMAEAMGIDIMTEEEYRSLQKFGEFDTKTSSWINTPSEIRKLGGALYADRRYGRVFIYHNSAPSYYNNRGFRGVLRV